MDSMSPPSEGSSNASMMRSYFYWGEEVQLLFSGWATRSRGSYVLTLAAVFLLALFHLCFGELKKVLLNLSSSPSFPHLNTNPPQSKFATLLNNFLSTFVRRRATHVILLTGTHILIAASGYLLMLVVMSFNIGVFLSVLAGLTLAFVLFEI